MGDQSDHDEHQGRWRVARLDGRMYRWLRAKGWIAIGLMVLVAFSGEWFIPAVALPLLIASQALLRRRYERDPDPSPQQQAGLRLWSDGEMRRVGKPQHE